MRWAALGVVYVVWGSTYLGIRFSIETMPPLLSAGARFVTAGLILALFLRGRMRMTWPQFGTAVLIGLLLPAWGNGLVVVAQQSVPSGLAALLVASVPLYVVLLRRIGGDRPPVVTYAGVVLGMVGLAVLLLDDVGGSTWWGPWLVLLAAFGWALGSYLSGRLPSADPFAMSAVEMVTGGVALTLVGVFAGEHVVLSEVSASSWWAWGYLVVFGSLLAFSAYVYVLGQLPVSTVATYAYVNPVIAVVLGLWLAGERFGPFQLVGGLLVVLAVVLVVRAERNCRT
ncbi:drug/metabolite transporter (DMT)-like permease [Saccharothrix tamanrassetensis]|uniref:Drug/metabolite transporter (DMT)-like permease n=1 Tax=Saccharothrix tamanrassetensis TaxID=1051531 RepID=A0A841CJ34_9PSEU|nr:EamA family transporter [Saccharothrix tamanrassetensis]MBB5955666.1 drug/metabolite transporter (DMT)-like permease [Saccharothrix tamanrassetensis]